MNSEQIQNFLNKTSTDKSQYVKINFQKREPIFGLILTSERDYKDLSTKNFWRVVSRKNLEQYKKSKDVNLSRIFSGSEITRLSLQTEEV
jgi:hypothetical protein